MCINFAPKSKKKQKKREEKERTRAAAFFSHPVIMAKEPHADYDYEIDFCPVKEAADKLCEPKCAKAWSEYIKCSERIKEHHGGHDCSAWYVDYWKCIDHCVCIIFTFFFFFFFFFFFIGFLYFSWYLLSFLFIVLASLCLPFFLSSLPFFFLFLFSNRLRPKSSPD